MYSDSTGQECLPVWPHSDYASALAKGSWADCKPYKIELSYFLDKWIPGMIQDERKVAVFTTPNEKGIVLNPKTLSEDLSEEIQKYE